MRTAVLHPDSPFIGYLLLHVWAVYIAFELRGWIHAAFFAFAPFNFLYWGYEKASETGLNTFSIAVCCWFIWTIAVMSFGVRQK